MNKDTNGSGTVTGGIGSEVGTKVVILTAGDRIFRLNKSRIVIGSVVSSDVRLGGEGVAPIHAVLETARDGDPSIGPAVIYDLASDTGLYVNGAKVVTATIKSGDEITIGRHKLKFSTDDISTISTRDRVKQTEGRTLFMNPNEDLSPLLLEDGRLVDEIFDYRPASKQALEVVMSWQMSIMDVLHFVDEKRVTVGPSRSNDFGIPSVMAQKDHPLVTRNGELFTLNLDPSMRGVIQSGGKLQSLDQVRSLAVQGAKGQPQIILKKDDFAKISIGEVDFYLSYTAAPPRLKRVRFFERDPFFNRLMFASMALTIGVLATLMSVSVPPLLETEQVPERLATILYQPEKFPPIVKHVDPPKPKETVKAVEPKPVTPPKAVVPPKPVPQKTVKVEIVPKKDVKKPIPKEMTVAPKAEKPKPAAQPKPAKAAPSKAQDQAKEGKGARAKGNEGTRGEKNAAKGDEHQTKAMRAAPEGGKGRGGGHSEIQDQGNLDVLKGATSTIQNLLGNTAANLGKGGEKLQGFGAFSTQGNGGLALSGKGKGGGGDAEGLGGLSDEGRGGGRVGTGMGAAGNGNGIIGGGKARVAIRTGGSEEAVVMGAIDTDGIEAAMLAHKDEFRLCYEREINAENPDLSGRVSTSFVIGSSGRVNQAGIASTSLNNANAERCILNVIKRIQFPVPNGGGVVQVTYPFKFNSINAK